MSIPIIEDQELLSSIRGKINRIIEGEFGRVLDVPLSNIAANTTVVNGPALCITSDNKIVLLPSGSSSPVDNANWIPLLTGVGYAGFSSVSVSFEITGTLGGTSSDLDAIDTTVIPVNSLFKFPNMVYGADAIAREYMLVAGTDAEDAPNGIVRPDDYTPGNNEKVWKAV